MISISTHPYLQGTIVHPTVSGTEMLAGVDEVRRTVGTDSRRVAATGAYKSVQLDTNASRLSKVEAQPV